MVFFCFCSFWCFSSFYYDNLLISLFSSYIYDSSAFFKAASLICISISGSFLESIMPCFLASSASFWICCFNCSWTFYLTYSSFFANLLAYWINLSFLLFFIFCWTSNFSTAYALTPTFSPSYLIKKFSSSISCLWRSNIVWSVSSSILAEVSFFSISSTYASPCCILCSRNFAFSSPKRKVSYFSLINALFFG